MRSQLPEGMVFVAESGGIEEYRMANGMKVLLSEQRAAPVVAFMVLYHVGSRNEAVGHTGATHLLEHMLFKGTPTFNARRGTAIATVLHRIGAVFNATTWFDRTNYYEAVPREHLELVMQLEADRMRNALILDEDREQERIVVRNELERGENDPLNVLEIHTWATAFREHPYHHPTIGWRSDVENVPTERLREFYHTFYWPNNATAIIVGDFDREKVLLWLERYFGVIPPSPRPIPKVYTVEPPQEGERRFVIRRAGEVGALMLGYHTPEATHPDIYPLAVLGRLLTGGVTTRLYQRLVDGELAISVRAFVAHLRDPGLFEITAVLRPGVEHARVEGAIRDEIARLQDAKVSEAELERAKNKIEAETFYARDGALQFAFALGEAEASADWQWFITYVPNVRRVTVEDIQRVAQTYLHQDNLTVGWFVPKNAIGSGPTASAGQPGMLWLHRPAFFAPEAPDASAGATEPLVGQSFAKRTLSFALPNGVRGLVLENRANPTVEVRAALFAGRAFEPVEQPELAVVTASMLMRGTERRSKLEIAAWLEDVGAEMHIGANRFLATASATSLSQDVGRLLETLAEVLREPVFPEEELMKLKSQMIGQIRRSQEHTGVRAFERFSQLIYDRSSPFYEPPASERVASIEAMTVEDVRRFHRAHYGPRHLVLVVVGDVVATEIVERIRRQFGDWSAEPAEDPRTRWARMPRTPLPEASLREVIYMPDKANVDVVLGHAGQLRRTDPDYVAAIIGNAALGYSTLSSRLGVRVRDQEGLTYGIISRFFEPSFLDGPWAVSVTVNPANVERAIASTMEVLTRYVAEGITAQELEDEKSAFVGSFLVGLGTNGGIAAQLLLAEVFGFGPAYLDHLPEQVRALTREEVNAAIRTYLHPERLITVIAGEYRP
ncbi:MAG: insulinase family protein [Blastocatellia bacterium]|nr:insulinase family protein [Blastocatellia bacterium]MCS7156655.1 insulinase family protein [Blastocatellia bacterium]MCX7751603.1 insulinase family protein [Blastocatellia bacterium]MDW8168703.1 pitrilysin family protein [Acidobacteriota bacterium]MDW8256969.1 pitrilysin family protein [Acidobacteriota bacterium]